AESDLRRAAVDQLVRVPADPNHPKAAKVALYTRGDGMPELKESEQDASEAPWLYLVLLVILVAEQAMAVHLSFHTHGAEGGEASPSARPAAGAAAAAPAAA